MIHGIDRETLRERIKKLQAGDEHCMSSHNPIKKVTSVHVILALAFIASFAVGSANPAKADARSGLSCASQLATLKLCSARTDNYKDCFNAPDNQRELRTWLAMTAVQARSATWKLTAGQSLFDHTLRVHRITPSGSLPRRALLVIRPTNPAQVTEAEFRVGDPSTFWGPIVTLTHEVSDAAPVRFSVRLTRTDGRELGHTTISYKYDSMLANAPVGSIEANGPGGRWYVGSKRTWTDWELGSGATC